MSRHLRTFSTFSRQLSRVPLPLQSGSNIQVQRVRFVRPVFGRRFWLKSIAYSVGVSYLWVKWVALDDEEEEHEVAAPQEETSEARESRALLKAVQDAERAALREHARESGDSEHGEALEAEEEDFDEDGLIPEEQPEDAWFVPLWIAREQPMDFYKANDPEWISYMEFNSDMRRRQRAKYELCSLLGQTFGNMKDFQRLLGTPVMVGKQWLEFMYPYQPPPEWERLGIEIADDYIAILHRPVEAKNVDRLKRTLWPVVAGQSLLASCNALWQLQVAKFRNAWNAIDSDPEKWRNQYRDNLRALLNSQEKDAAGKPLPESRSSTPSIQLSSQPSQVEQSLSLPLPSLPQPSSDLKKATHVFRGSFAKNTKLDVQPPRGTFIVAGLVELVGSKGICVLDVQASYNPQESRYVTIHVSPRRATKRKLAPKG